jgi:hypothetical protein
LIVDWRHYGEGQSGSRCASQTAIVALILARSGAVWAQATVKSPKCGFEIHFPASLHQQPITGRVFLVITRNGTREPRLRVGGNSGYIPRFGLDVVQLKPGELAVIDAGTLGYPLASLHDIPPGDYYVQAALNIYTQFHRADGHVIWAHMDQWEGQYWYSSPGNLISEPKKLHLDPAVG